MLTLARLARCNGFLFLSMLAVLALPVCALADKIVMKNGGVFEGEVVEEKETEIVLKMQYGTMAFKKDQIKSITKGKYTPPKPRPAPPAAPTDTTGPAAPFVPWEGVAENKDGKAQVETGLAELLNKADKEVRARHFETALDLLDKAKALPSATSPEAAAGIEAKIKKVKELALVVIEIDVQKVSTAEDARDPAVRRKRDDAEPVSDAGVKREVAEALTAMFERALREKGFIPVTKQAAPTRRIQKLTVRYSETGGAAYLDNDGNVVGYRIQGKCHIDLTTASGGTAWSGDIEAITPDMIRHGTPREETLYLLQQKAMALGYGVSE